MEKKKSSKVADPPSDNHLRIKHLLTSLEREFDILLNENVQRKLKIDFFFSRLLIIDC